MPSHKITISEMGKETIERNMSVEEDAELTVTRDEINSHRAAEVATALANATAKAELLTRLGITADEAKLLLG